MLHIASPFGTVCCNVPEHFVTGRTPPNVHQVQLFVPPHSPSSSFLNSAKNSLTILAVSGSAARMCCSNLGSSKHVLMKCLLSLIFLTSTSFVITSSCSRHVVDIALISLPYYQCKHDICKFESQTVFLPGVYAFLCFLLIHSIFLPVSYYLISQVRNAFL